MKRLAVLGVALCFASGNPAFAAACHDAKGKFITCPAPAAAKKTCRDVKGKFIKCTAVPPT